MVCICISLNINQHNTIEDRTINMNIRRLTLTLRCWYIMLILLNIYTQNINHIQAIATYYNLVFTSLQLINDNNK